MTSRRLPALVAALLALATLLPSAAGAQTTRTPRQEQIIFGIGCPPANPAGSCATTEYFLSKQPGTSSVGNLVSGAAWALRTAGGGERTFDTYSPDKTLAPSYLLQGGRELTGEIRVGGFVGGAELAADSSVAVRISVHIAGAPASQRVTLVNATITKPVVTPGDTLYAFTATIPAALDGVRVDGLRAEVAHDSATVLGNGFVNGRGGSFFFLPHYSE
jgi:hypothetical protein